MSKRFRILLLILMTTALSFGFISLFTPKTIPYNFDRLHIFLFNLCSGGVVLIYFTEGRPSLSRKAVLFLCLAISYAVFAFLEIYIPVLVLTLALMAIVESVRIQRFSFFPFDFFKPRVPVSEKFHQASLLCLSMGLFISSLVLLNNEYLKLVTSFPKLQLDTFFLGFSFPLSLITMSLIFSFMADDGVVILVLKNIGFWFVNLGVIIFFLFIIFEKLPPQVLVTSILFFTVVMIFYLFITLGQNLQQKAFLVSGIGFLLYTAITGILYIIYEMAPGYSPENMKWLMRMHSFASLYGWNLSGLAIICRYNDFPLRLHSRSLLILHWITVAVIAPLGCYYPLFAVSAILCYTVILYLIFFTNGRPVSVKSS
ncbi:MAG: hypothetical protein C4518_06320 [Desulfobacteraceae bacterium]|nr:MAG: hypothetical protein C4518_06320 [Desulfobacteraceae bacterium]